jgi:RNA polymerase sigma factor (TIGR02999 family)
LKCRSFFDSVAHGDDDITELLRQWQDGDSGAGALVVAQTYGELRRIARAHMRHERFAESLGATGLLHEAYLRLLRNGPGTVENRQAFFRVMAAEMRHRLVDRARRRRAVKRGGGAAFEPLGDEPVAVESTDPLADPAALDRLDRALEQLVSSEPRAARVVQLRFLAGMSNEEAAAELGVSPRTVKRDWAFARAWLAAAIEGPAS